MVTHVSLSYFLAISIIFSTLVDITECVTPLEEGNAEDLSRPDTFKNLPQDRFWGDPLPTSELSDFLEDLSRPDTSKNPQQDRFWGDPLPTSDISGYLKDLSRPYFIDHMDSFPDNSEFLKENVQSNSKWKKEYFNEQLHRFLSYVRNFLSADNSLASANITDETRMRLEKGEILPFQIVAPGRSELLPGSGIWVDNSVLNKFSTCKNNKADVLIKLLLRNILGQKNVLSFSVTGSAGLQRAIPKNVKDAVFIFANQNLKPKQKMTPKVYHKGLHKFFTDSRVYLDPSIVQFIEINNKTDIQVPDM